jgi:sulfatase maturation enzyme AslB (radical SAM superfamily)
MTDSKEQILKQYVCLNPFRYLDIQDNSQWVCCPSWCPTNIRVDDKNIPLHQEEYIKEDLVVNWKGAEAEKVRKSVLDGSYQYCDHNICPSLSQLINAGKIPKNFIEKDKFDKNLKNSLPEEILFGFDRSCNLKCPSCRAELVANSDLDSDEFKHKEFLLSEIESKFSYSIKKIMITGSGDPFYSKLFRDFLINFDERKYPNLENIHIITNGILLNEKMWDSLKANKFIKSIEISVDAGTKHTYENITRLNGKWDILTENIKFLSSKSTLKDFGFSMVVSEYNYKEMLLLYNHILEIFKESKIKPYVYYRQLAHWQASAYSPLRIKEISVFDRSHHLFDDFIIELKKINKLPHTSHNFHHLLK